MSGDRVPVERWRRLALVRDREITPNERFWLETIRLASQDEDPIPTLERAQKLRLIFAADSPLVADRTRSEATSYFNDLHDDR